MISNSVKDVKIFVKTYELLTHTIESNYSDLEECLNACRELNDVIEHFVSSQRKKLSMRTVTGEKSIKELVSLEEKFGFRLKYFAKYPEAENLKKNILSHFYQDVTGPEAFKKKYEAALSATDNHQIIEGITMYKNLNDASKDFYKTPAMLDSFCDMYKNYTNKAENDQLEGRMLLTDGVIGFFLNLRNSLAMNMFFNFLDNPEMQLTIAEKIRPFFCFDSSHSELKTNPTSHFVSLFTNKHIDMLSQLSKKFAHDNDTIKKYNVFVHNMFVKTDTELKGKKLLDLEIIDVMMEKKLDLDSLFVNNPSTYSQNFTDFLGSLEKQNIKVEQEIITIWNEYNLDCKLKEKPNNEQIRYKL